MVVITGSNTGIGKETVLDLAKRGARIIMCCRDLKKAEVAKQDIKNETGNDKIEVLHLDLSSLKSVRKCANALVGTVSKVRSS